MGARGPVPKRSDQRRRRNKDGVITKGVSTGVVEWPEPSDLWHPVAVAWYQSLEESGQSDYYEPSDVWTARYVAEAMSRNLQHGRFSAQLFAAVMSAMTELLTTEGARRRARMELQRDPAEVEDPRVAVLANYRDAAKRR